MKLGVLVSLIAAMLLTVGCAQLGCEPEEGEGPPLANRLDVDQVAARFFEAYKSGDREAALRVAESKAVDKLQWDGGAANNPTLQLMEEAIVYEGGAIHLVIHRDGHVGARIVDVELIAD